MCMDCKSCKPKDFGRQAVTAVHLGYLASHHSLPAPQTCVDPVLDLFDFGAVLRRQSRTAALDLNICIFRVYITVSK